MTASFHAEGLPVRTRQPLLLCATAPGNSYANGHEKFGGPVSATDTQVARLSSTRRRRALRLGGGIPFGGLDQWLGHVEDRDQLIVDSAAPHPEQQFVIHEPPFGVDVGLRAA